MRGPAWALLALLSVGAAQDDAFDRTMAALQSGSAAEASGDTRQLRRAANDLRASGAEPLVGSDDLAVRWTLQGRSIPAAPFRDRVLGPGYRSITLEGNGVWRSEQAFLAGQRARVGVVLVHAGAFTMQIVDDDRETVCHASPSHNRCDWVPAYTARFRIEVHNPGARAAAYLIVVD